MAGIGEKLWDIGKSPPQLIGLLVFGLVALLTGLMSVAMLFVVGDGPTEDAISMVAFALIGVGGFFVTLTLFLGAYTAPADSWTTTVWKIAQLIAAVLVLTFVFFPFFVI